MSTFKLKLSANHKAALIRSWRTFKQGLSMTLLYHLIRGVSATNPTARAVWHVIETKWDYILGGGLLPMMLAYLQNVVKPISPESK